MNEYRDPTPIEEIEYNPDLIPEEIRKNSNYVRSKMYGEDVREAVARSAEISGIIAAESEKHTNEMWEDWQQVNKEWDSDPNKDPELVLARGEQSSLRDRLEESDRQLEQNNLKIGDTSLIGSGFTSIIHYLLGFGLNVKEYGVKGDGETNDTEALQRFMDEQVESFNVVIFPAGTYLVENLVLPEKNRVRYISLGATIRAIDAGDDNYLIATNRYVNNIPEADHPVKEFSDFQLDANNVKDFAFAMQSWDSTFSENRVTGAIRAGLVITTITRDGSEFTSSTLVNNRIYNNWFIENGERGMWVRDPSRNRASDYFIENNFANRNGRGFDLQCCAGTLFKGNHTYSNDVALYIHIGSLAFRIVDNYFEETNDRAVHINDMNNGISVIFSGNTMRGGFYVYGGSGGAARTIQSSNNNFLREGHIHLEWDANTKILSTNDTFVTDRPYRTNTTSAPSQFFAYNSISYGLGTNRILNGLQHSANNRQGTIEYRYSLPEEGSYRVGDKIIRTRPEPNSHEGWICISSGIFGTDNEPEFRGYGSVH